MVLVLMAPALWWSNPENLNLINPEVTDYYVRVYVNLCVLNTAKNVAYPYARTVRCTDEVMFAVPYRTGTVRSRYGTLRYNTGTDTVPVPYCTILYRTVPHNITNPDLAV